MENKRGKSKFPLLAVILILFLVFAGYFLITSTAPIEKYFPPESPEVTAMRQSPDNGFYALERVALRYEPKGSLEPINFPDIYREGWPEDPEVQEEILMYLRTIDPILSDLRSSLHPEYYLLPEIGDFEMELPYLAPWRSMARALTAQAKWFEENGKFEDAMKNYLDTTRLGMLAGQDSILINRLVGIAIELIALEGLDRSLNKYDDQRLLERALSELLRIDAEGSPFRNAMENEFRMNDNAIQEFLNDPAEGLAQLENSSYSLAASGTTVGTGGANRIKRTMEDLWNGLVEMSVGIPILRDLLANRTLQKHDRVRGSYYDAHLKALEKPLRDFRTNAPEIPSDWISQILFPALEKAPMSDVRRDALLKGTIIAVALRIYALDNGDFPEDLSTLAPDNLETVPLDPCSGKAFVYEKLKGDFRLYSFGQDLDDDGGKPYQNIFPNGDIVIHLPQSEWDAP